MYGIDRRPCIGGAFWLLAMAMAFSGFVSCGATGDSESPTAKAALAPQPSHGSRLHPPRRDHGVRAGGLLACSSASTFLGDTPGAIEFQVRCKPRPGEQTVSFGISGRSAYRQGKLGIHAFRHRPAVTGVDGFRTHGRCEVIASRDIACSARVEQSARVSGRIWVRREARCSVDVTISAAQRRHCTSICSANSISVILASGPPRGC